MQVLQKRWDPTFSENSYGFRPGRSAHQAVAKAQEYIQQGYDWVVDLDLEKFFDRVNHDVLMSRVAKRISDKRMLKLIRGFLSSGVMETGLWARRTKERHKAVLFRRFFPICCSTIWTESWSDVGIASFATQMTVIST